MNEYSLQLLGMTISFATDANEERVEEARVFLEEQFSILSQRASRNSSKELLLIYLALGLADELLLQKNKICIVEENVQKLMNRLDK